MKKASILAGSDTVLQQETKRAEGRENLAIYHGVYVQDWMNHIYIENEEVVSSAMGNGKETLKLEVYEWNWVVYNDGKGGPQDEMGFAITHEMTLEKDAAGRYQIVADEYDESDLLGTKEKTFKEVMQEAEKARAEAADMAQEIMKEVNNGPSAVTLLSESGNTNKKGYANYHPIDAATYADNWVNHHGTGGYNSNYKSYPGSDCANYVSQCLKAGGMQNDKYSGSVGWWYDSIGSTTATHNNSMSWSEVGNFQKYWVTEKGYKKVSATMNNVYPGNPMVNSKNTHVGICVGYNASGVPILNGHTDDQYHVPMTSWASPFTIQIVENAAGRRGPNEALTLDISNAEKQKDILIEKDQWIWYKVEIDGKSSYTFSGTSSSDSSNFCAGMYIYRPVSKNNSSIYMDEVKKVESTSASTTNFRITILPSDSTITAGTYYIQIRGLNSVYGRGTIHFRYRKNG